MTVRTGQNTVQGQNYCSAYTRPTHLETQVSPARPDDVVLSNKYVTERLFWRQNHHHLPTFHRGLRLNLGDVQRFRLHPVEQLVAQILMGHFTATEPQCELDLVALFKKPAHLFVVDKGCCDIIEDPVERTNSLMSQVEIKTITYAQT